MNTTQKNSEFFDPERLVITLLDGRELPCTLKPEQPKEIKTDSLKLDTTGQYLSFKNKGPKFITDAILKRARRQYNHHLFTENAWFLLDNAEKIFSDSRMFLTPVKIVNGLAYTGTSGFWKPTVGVYLEWWLNHKAAATDKNGNLVWYISGSPLSGNNCCSSATPEGQQVGIAQRTSFSAIWGSFMDVNNRYTEAKQRCEAYTLEELLIKLRGEDYRYRLIELKHEMIQEVMDWEKNETEKAYYRLIEKTKKLIKDNRKIQLRQHREEIMEFYKTYETNHKEVMELEKVYGQKHKELKKQLHDGTLEGDYNSLLAEASREYRKKKAELSLSLNKFIQTTFGKNPNEISPTDVIRYAGGKPLNFKISL